MDKSNAQGNALEIINPTGQELTLADGSTVTVRPLSLGQLPRFVQAIRPAFGALVALVPASSSPGNAGGHGADPEGGMDVLGLLSLYADHGDALNQALAIVTGEPVARIEGLALDDGMRLVMAMWEVNRDFFVHRVLPLLSKANGPQ